MANKLLPLMLGCAALLIALIALILGVYQYVHVGFSRDCFISLILFVAGTLSAINLLRIHRKLNHRR